MTDIDLPKPLWKSPIFLVSMAVCLLIFLFGAYLFFIWAPPLVISEKTTRITGPLTAKGEIDFFKALEQRFYPPELATDDNGFRDFVRLFGDVSGMSSDPEFYRLQKYEKLGLDPNVPPTLALPLAHYVVVENFYKTKGEAPPANPRRDFLDPWTLEDYPMLEEWINDIDTPLDAVTEAIRKPIFFVPFMQSPKSVSSGNPQNLIALLLLDVQYLRDVARMFQARSTYRVAQGNIDGAIEDKLTSMRFGRLVPQGGCMVQHLVGIAIEVGGIAIPVGANPEHPLTEQQIRRLLDGIDALPPRVPLNDVFEWERYSGLSTAQETVKGRISLFDIGSLTKASPLERAALSSCDWNVIYRRVNEVYDAMQEPSPKTKFHSLIPAPGRMFTAGKVTGLSNSNARGHFAADLLITLCIPEVDAMEEAVLRSECAENLQRLSLAVLLYQCENGKLPDENWAAQIEKYLGENPKQHFSCPSNPSPEGQTTYAMMQYGDKVDSRNVLMFVELTAPVPLDKAVVSVDDVLNRRNTGSLHPGGMVTSYYSTTVRFISNTVNDEELRRLLGQ